MRTRIVFKLFLLTAALCMLILAAVVIGQTVFFKQFYANQKVNETVKSIRNFANEYEQAPGSEQAILQLEQKFYDQYHVWITPLDRYGNVHQANDFAMEVKLDSSQEHPELSNKEIRVPLYHLVNQEEILGGETPQLAPGMRISMYGIVKDSALIPYIIGKTGIFPPGTLGALTPAQLEGVKGQPFWENRQLEEQVNQYLHEKSSGTAGTSPVTMIIGTVQAVHVPQDSYTSLSYLAPQSFFMERARAFQADLLMNPGIADEPSLQITDEHQNDIPYKQVVLRVKDSVGGEGYLFAMVSLQPVDDALNMVKAYYGYVLGFAILLILFASYYYSRKIAGPLLQINRVTEKIANLNFSEKVPVLSRDEIGDLAKNINTLSDALHSRIEQLKQDIEKEKKLENTRKEFIASVSHELKNPLSVMKSCLSAVKDGVARHKNDYYMAALEKEVDRMNLLVVDMLELAKFESGTYQMKGEPFSIDEAIHDACGLLTLDMKNKHLDLKIQVDQASVWGNRQRIEQVLANFLTNAIRYSPENQSIHISAREEGEAVKVSVENKGARIPEDQLDKIWDRFYRGDAARKRSDGGTGLGLAICKNILELHGARYGAMNTEDGVLFFFYLHKA